jgi:hypothetical protein
MARVTLKVADRVKQLLQENPKMRDNDNLLIARIWGEHLLDQGIQPQSHLTSQFLRVLAKGQLPSSESIRRSRQKVQEHCPELRGQLYGARKQNQSKVKKEVRESEHIVSNQNSINFETSNR